MSVSVSRRFEVFERDAFRCRYCGKSAEEGARLEADHLHPRSKGGSDEIGNLVTACWECNHGKRAKVLRPVPKRRHRPRFVSIAPTIEEPEPVYEIGASCVTPLRIALVGRFMGCPSYSASYRYLHRLMPDTLKPPQRRSDAAWYRLVDQGFGPDEPYGQLAVSILDQALAPK